VKHAYFDFYLLHLKKSSLKSKSFNHDRTNLKKGY